MEKVRNQDELLGVLHACQLRLTHHVNCVVSSFADGTTVFQAEKYGKVIVTVFKPEWDEYRTNNELDKMRQELGL